MVIYQINTCAAMFCLNGTMLSYAQAQGHGERYQFTVWEYADRMNCNVRNDNASVFGHTSATWKRDPKKIATIGYQDYHCYE